MLALTSCGDADRSVAVTAPAGSPGITVQIGTDGDASAPTKVEYTCPGSGASPVCGPEVVHGRWTKTLNVPVGTEVWIHVTPAKQDDSGSTPNCWITDAPGRKTYSKSDDGSCFLQINEAPPT
jgi:hypothetical protein